MSNNDNDDVITFTNSTPGVVATHSPYISQIDDAHHRNSFAESQNTLRNMFDHIGNMGAHDQVKIIDEILNNAHPDVLRMVGFKVWIHAKLDQCGLDNPTLRNTIYEGLMARGFGTLYGEYAEEKQVICDKIAKLVQQYKSLEEGDRIMSILKDEVRRCNE